MSTVELLVAVRQARIVLTVQGDRLSYVAPPGAMTPALRDALGRHKADLIAVLTLPPLVALKDGPTVPVAALRLALDLEARGIRLAIDEDHRFMVPTDRRLSVRDYDAIERWRHHLGALVEYQAPTVG